MKGKSDSRCSSIEPCELPGKKFITSVAYFLERCRLRLFDEPDFVALRKQPPQYSVFNHLREQADDTTF